MDGDTCNFLPQSAATFRRWAEGGRKTSRHQKPYDTEQGFLRKKSQCVPMYVCPFSSEGDLLFFFCNELPGKKGRKVGRRGDDGCAVAAFTAAIRGVAEKKNQGRVPPHSAPFGRFICAPHCPIIPCKNAAGGGAPSKPVLMHPGGKGAILRVGSPLFAAPFSFLGFPPSSFCVI